MEKCEKTYRFRARTDDSPGAASCGYQRRRDLPRLLALWPDEINDKTAEGIGKLIAKLQRVLRAERQRGRAGHWSYDLDRHLGLVKAYKGEVTSLEKLIRAGSKPEGQKFGMSETSATGSVTSTMAKQP